MLGTTDYVSPEQAMGKEVDARTDVYSLGIVLYEMLTGEVPFKAETQVGVAMKHVNETIPDVQRRRPEVSAALAAALERATAKDPEDRYPDMNCFLADLEGALEVEVARAGDRPARRRPVLDSVPRRQRRLRQPARASRWVGALLLIARGGCGARDRGADRRATGIAPGAAAGRAARERRSPIDRLPTDFDPDGGDGEHEDTDRRTPSTATREHRLDDRDLRHGRLLAGSRRTASD